MDSIDGRGLKEVQVSEKLARSQQKYRVLVVGSSITKYGELVDIFGEETIDTTWIEKEITQKDEDKPVVKVKDASFLVTFDDGKNIGVYGR